MSEFFDHLDLQRIPDEFLRKKRNVKLRYQRGDRNREDFSRNILQSFENLQQIHEEDKNRYQGFIDPKLIFKLNVNQSVFEESFKNSLRLSGIEVISPSPDNKGYWIVFANDEKREAFESRLRQYVQEDSYKFFDAIDELKLISPEEKIGESLQKKPFSKDEFSYLDVEIWRMEDSELTVFLLQLTNMIRSKNGSVEDTLTTTSFCLLRVLVNYYLYLDILNLREVSHVDRPPRFKLEVSLTPDIEDLVVDDKPPENACGILVIDSGIRSNHPLLRNAVGNAIAIPRVSNPSILDDDPSDEVGHGTEVSGIAAYGDLQECLEDKTFKPETWIFSAKVMFKDEDGYASYNEKELLAHQLEKAVRGIVNTHQNCKVVNLSIGDPSKRMTEGKRQFNLASLIDSLAKELNIIFVISAGNIGDIPIDADIPESYPDYLIDETTDYFKIIDPASSALAITVGAVSKNRISIRQDVYDDYPSRETRVGMGYKGMIKPELVENGGGGFGNESDVMTTNWDWIGEGRLFTLVSGTSYSAPKVSNQLARLINQYPHKSTNFIKALLLSSSNIPENRPDCLSEINFKSCEYELREILKIYGYGKPNFEKALHSESNRVLLINESKIKLNHFHVYQIFIPEDFLEKGDKILSVTLVFDPPTNKNRIEYLGVNFETHLFKNFGVQEIIDLYSSVEIKAEMEDIVPKELKGKDIKLKPGTTVRKKGVHQKSIIKYTGKPDFDTGKPLIFVVICQDKWVKNQDYLQDYAVVVSVEHSNKIDLYSQIRLRNRERLSVTLRE